MPETRQQLVQLTYVRTCTDEINSAFEIFLMASEKEWVLKQQFIVPAVSQLHYSRHDILHYYNTVFFKLQATLLYLMSLDIYSSKTEQVIHSDGKEKMSQHQKLKL